MRHLRRRLLTIPTVLFALPLLVLFAPIWLVLGIVVDLAGRLFRFPTVRLGLFVVLYLAHEWAGIAASCYIGLRAALVTRTRGRADELNPYRRVQAWWATSLLVWARRLLGVRFEIPDVKNLPAGSLILLSRHASMVDAVLPIRVMAAMADRYVHYVIKQELRWVPNLDIYGHRLDNYFIARFGDSDAETEAIARFAENALPESVLVIFPEGTYATDKNRDRVIASLERRGDQELASYGRALRHLLPPKPAGTLALLANRPEADVVVFGHVGLEGVAQLGGLRRCLPLRDPVVIDWWHHRRDELPKDDAGQVAWLNARWRTLDDWVASIAGNRRF